MLFVFAVLVLGLFSGFSDTVESLTEDFPDALNAFVGAGDAPGATWSASCST
ncbi:hypothetical protein [Streptomyces poriticola]|uniref:hypothetical protein n=1 Tax=Streptomyces poriticola TaxID=3120506 RepID=UPI002FCE286E